LKKGELVELNIEKYAFEGKGIAKVLLNDNAESTDKKFVVFVNHAYPGEKVKARIVKKKNFYAEAKIEEIVSPSPLRTKPLCKYFGICGGCKQQDMIYDSQVKFKQEQVVETFERLGGFTGLNIDPILKSEKVFHYRNKMDFSFADKRWLVESEINNTEILDRNFALGLHIPNMFDKVLDVNECFIQPAIGNDILNFTREFFKSRNIPIYSTKTHTGFLRNLVIRFSFHTNDLMVNLVTSSEDDNLLREYSSELLKRVPAITTIINNINLKKASIALGDYEKIFHGTGFIYDLIGDYKFRISANSFFQTNTLQAENLYKKTLEFCGLRGDETIYDLFCGAGTISIYVSGQAKNVFGFESVGSAISDAGINTEFNVINNVNFFQADLYNSILPSVREKNLPLPDVIITDPPRSGMHQRTVNDIIELSPKKIVYVSCNPATQVRDVVLLTAAGYKLVKMQPVDMFPHTYHIENIVLLEQC
jgi:23S rRNA (uracil1939-C5)-methyltransferase